MSAVDKVLDKLVRVKRVRNGQWMAACPICNSKNGRPLAIKEATDGRVLIYGFCGHETGEVVSALGLSIADLFDRPLIHNRPPIPNKVSARDALNFIDHEALVIGMLALEFRNKGALTNEDWDRLATAAARIGWARDAVNAR